MRVEETGSAPSMHASMTVTPKPCRAPSALQELRRAAARLAEMKIVARHGGGEAEPADQHIADEILGAAIGERAVEGQDQRAVKPERSGKRRLQRRRRQPVERPAGKEGARMRLEGQHDAGDIAPLRLRPRRRQHRLMAAMHAVEIADGHDPAPPGLRQIVERGYAGRFGR